LKRICLCFDSLG